MTKSASQEWVWWSGYRWHLVYWASGFQRYVGSCSAKIPGDHVTLVTYGDPKRDAALPGPLCKRCRWSAT